MDLPNRHVLLALYRQMLVIRRFEEAVSRAYRAGHIPGFVHLYIGEEAVACGICAHLEADDYIASTHRGHGHALAKGMPARELMAELWGRRTGCSGGRGGSMHLSGPEYGLLGTNGIVAPSILTAAGAAFSAQYRGTRQVAVAFFGDGANNTGSFHEGLNMASLWKLPVVFVCENNLYATQMPLAKATAGQSIAARAASYAMPGVEVDGQDVMAVYNEAGQALARARAGGGPTLVECRTYRYVGHHEGDPGTGYRAREEIEKWRKRDPIRLFSKTLMDNQIVALDELDAIQNEVEAVIGDAVDFADGSAWPSPEDAGTRVFANPIQAKAKSEPCES
jgi:pyruvate dehydrogenase E1 component alpha subunit